MNPPNPTIIESTITLGNLLSIVVTIVSIFIATFVLGSRLGRLEFKLNLIWEWYRKEHHINRPNKDE